MPENPLVPQPVPVTIAGRACSLQYPFRAVIQYQRETAKIERSRDRKIEADPVCICGARKSAHFGPSLIRLGDKDRLLCARFREQDHLLGDSLFAYESWRAIDLNTDPERWFTCLWCGLHEKQSDGNWAAPFTFAELEEKIGISPDTRRISDLMFDALAAWMPKAEPVPNVTAPGEPAPAEAKLSEPNSTAKSSGVEPGLATASAAPSS